MKVKMTKVVYVTEEVEVNDNYFEKNEEDADPGYISEWTLSKEGEKWLDTLDEDVLAIADMKGDVIAEL